MDRYIKFIPFGGNGKEHDVHAELTSITESEFMSHQTMGKHIDIYLDDDDQPYDGVAVDLETGVTVPKDNEYFNGRDTEGVDWFLEEKREQFLLHRFIEKIE